MIGNNRDEFNYLKHFSMSPITRLPIAAIGAAGNMMVDSADKTNSPEVTSCSAYTTLKETNQRYQASIGKQTGSFETKTVVAADKQRDFAVVGIRENVHSKLFWPDSHIAEAANHLEPMVHKYAGNIENEPYNEESTYIHSFLAKLAEPEWQQDIDLLGIRPLIEHLAKMQQNFEQVQRNRAVSSASISEVKAASNLRRELENAIRGFMKFAEAMDTVNPGGVWHQLTLTIHQQLEEIERGHRTGGNPSQNSLNND